MAPGVNLKGGGPWESPGSTVPFRLSKTMLRNTNWMYLNVEVVLCTHRHGDRTQMQHTT